MEKLEGKYTPADAYRIHYGDAPRLGIFLTWELRSPGSSIRFFRREIFMMVGIV